MSKEGEQTETGTERRRLIDEYEGEVQQIVEAEATIAECLSKADVIANRLAEKFGMGPWLYNGRLIRLVKKRGRNAVCWALRDEDVSKVEEA